MFSMFASVSRAERSFAKPCIGISDCSALESVCFFLCNARTASRDGYGTVLITAAHMIDFCWSMLSSLSGELPLDIQFAQIGCDMRNALDGVVGVEHDEPGDLQLRDAFDLTAFDLQRLGDSDGVHDDPR